jgi:hypothetical protein
MAVLIRYAFVRPAGYLERWAQWNMNQSLEITTEKSLSLSLSCVSLYTPS